MLYAAEWPCCHDPLRLGLCFEDLSTHARAPRVVDNPLPTHATCAAPLRCHRAARAGGSPSFLLASIATGRRRETCTSHSSRARAQDAAAPHLHLVEECACRPVAPLSISSPFSISSTSRRRETCTSHSSRARAQDAAAPHFIVLRWYSGVSWARSGPWRLASRRPRPVAVALRFASA